MSDPATPPTLVIVGGSPGSGKTTLARIQTRAQDDPLRRAHADPAGADAAEHEKAHRAFRRLSAGVPELEVDTTGGYRPSFGQILFFISEGAIG